jgi:argininosuccinate lyase
VSTLWQARFGGTANELAQRYTASIQWDQHLAPYDIRYSQAHIKALQQAGVLDGGEVATLHDALEQVRAELEAGELELDPALEDIHTIIENRVTEIAGDAGAKLHTGRSRNDQCVTVMRLFMLDATDDALASIRRLQAALVDQAVKHQDTVVPAYSHMRRAQPIKLAHHLLAYFWMLQRDRERLESARTRTALSGAGAAACAGTGIPLDRASMAADLGFDGVTQNSLDTVSDRDFILEFLAAATLCGGHISRLAADLCLWSGPEFDFAELDMAYCTGSSMMPQKVNPDTMELARAKVATLSAELTTLIGITHALPLGYQRDLQDDKRPLLNGAEVLISTLDLMAGVIATTEFNVDAMAAAADDPGLLAADWAEELVQGGVPFRDAYGVIGGLMREASETGTDPRSLPEANLAALHPALPAAIAAVPDAAAAIDRKATSGSPGRIALAEQIAAVEALLGAT